MRNNNGYHRVIAFLDRRALDYIDGIGKNALFTSGSKLSRVKIIKAAVNVLMKLGITGKGIGSVEEFEKEIFNKIKDFNSGEEEDSNVEEVKLP